MSITAENISFRVEGTPSDLGEAADYALRKARAFPDEGGAVVVAVDVPETIARAAMVEHLFAYGDSVLPHEADDMARLTRRCNGVIQFDAGPGLDALLSAWQGLTKEIRGVS